MKSTVSESAQELGSPANARNESVRVEKDKGIGDPFQDAITDASHVDPSRSHFNLTWICLFKRE